MASTPHCEMVKKGDVAIADFDTFLEHVNDCHDCQRRISTQIITKFKQKQNGDI
jgi:hypothetical protein